MSVEQRARIDAHAKAALLMAGILFKAGAFTGIMTGTGMLKAMAQPLSPTCRRAWATHPRSARVALDATEHVVRS